jgi:hypothetical protein
MAGVPTPKVREAGALVETPDVSQPLITGTLGLLARASVTGSRADQLLTTAIGQHRPTSNVAIFRGIWSRRSDLNRRSLVRAARERSSSREPSMLGDVPQRNFSIRNPGHCPAPRSVQLYRPPRLTAKAVPRCAPHSRITARFPKGFCDFERQAGGRRNAKSSIKTGRNVSFPELPRTLCGG